jgi:hypothetical protein
VDPRLTPIRDRVARLEQAGEPAGYLTAYSVIEHHCQGSWWAGPRTWDSEVLLWQATLHHRADLTGRHADPEDALAAFSSGSVELSDGRYDVVWLAEGTPEATRGERIALFDSPLPGAGAMIAVLEDISERAPGLLTTTIDLLRANEGSIGLEFLCEALSRTGTAIRPREFETIRRAMVAWDGSDEWLVSVEPLVDPRS